MKVGQLMLFQNRSNLPQSDFDMYQNELDIALMSEPLGLDSIWAVEHHFTDYTLCPNIPQFLVFVAGQTKRIKLGTAAIILPWHKDPKKAEDMAYHYMSDYWISAMVHYEMKGEHFSDRGKGAYDFYHEAAKAMRKAGDEAMGRQFADLQIWGTPAQCLERIESIQSIIGPMDINCSFSFAGMPYEYARQSMKLFAEQVVPVVRDWEAPGYQAA